MSTANLLLATEKSLDKVLDDLDEALEVARGHQLAWMESEAAVLELQTEAAQIRAAVRALKGEVPEEPSAECSVQPESGDSTPPPEEETADEFEARLKRERAARQREKAQTGPYAGMKCSSCGSEGTLYDSIKQMKGKPVAIIACEKCASVRMR